MPAQRATSCSQWAAGGENMCRLPFQAYTWLDAHDSNTDIPPLSTPMRKYAASLYFAVYTLTSTGYGDIAAQNTLEYFTAALFMALGGLFWAFTIGNFCSIVSTLDVHGIAFRQLMDEANIMMEDRRLSSELRQRVRAYFHQSKSMQARRRVLFFFLPTPAQWVMIPMLYLSGQPV